MNTDEHRWIIGVHCLILCTLA